MSTPLYLAKMKGIQLALLNYLDQENDFEENYEKLIQLFNNHQIQEAKNVLKSVLYLISRISNNHHRTPNFFSKIDKIMQFFQSSITKHFTNNEIFDIFKSNKRILLFLIKEKILIFDQYIADIMTKTKYIKMKYPHYFAPEINPFLNRQVRLKILYTDCYPEIPDSSDEDEEQDEEDFDENDENGTKHSVNKKQNKKDKYDVKEEEDCSENQNFFEDIVKNTGTDFEEKRNFGENDTDICKLIRNDNEYELAAFLIKSNLSYTDEIKQSIFETNRFLLKYANYSIIEYAAFCGSIKIFDFLFTAFKKIQNDLSYAIESLWGYAVHSNNSEIIKILENAYKEQDNENGAEKIPDGSDFKQYICLSIQCHHNEIAKYIHSKILKSREEIIDSIDNSIIFHHYNFAFFPKIFNSKVLFSYLCQYDYYIIVKDLMKTKKWNLNSKAIYCIFFL